MSTIKIQLNATAAPTVNDDITLGYVVGSFWHDTINDNSYVCVDNTDGAAVWKLITATTAAQVGAEPANANIQSHISSTANPHGVTKTQVGLDNVQNINWCDYVPMSVNSITITDDHKGKTIWTTSASSVSAAVASDLGMDFVCGVIQGGAGQVTFSGLGDVTIENQNNHTKTAGLRAAATLRILPDGTCKLIGETA